MGVVVYMGVVVHMYGCIVVHIRMGVVVNTYGCSTSGTYIHTCILILSVEICTALYRGGYSLSRSVY
jgi:hypothetical protein